MAWAIGVIAEGLYPPTRHDGKQWPEDSDRAALAGRSLGFHVAITMVKGDWDEFAHTLGFPSWAHHAHPCFACTCKGGPSGNMAQYAGMSPVTLPFPLKTMESYLAACGACEKLVLVRTPSELQRLLGVPRV